MKLFLKASLLIIPLIINNRSSAQTSEDAVMYYNQNEKQISKEEFKKLTEKSNFKPVKNDSLERYRILPNDRTEKGKIENGEEIILKIEERTNSRIDKTQPMVIIFYPGKDPCNTSGSATYRSRKEWFKILEKKIFKISRTSPIYLYKKAEGLGKYNGIINWFKDPENITEKTFFRFHYPCGSYVIISPNGNYISFFGEFSKDILWSHLEELKKKQ